MNRVFLTAEEAAEALHISRSKVYDLIRNDDLVSIKIGWLRRVPVDAVEDFARRRPRRIVGPQGQTLVRPPATDDRPGPVGRPPRRSRPAPRRRPRVRRRAVRRPRALVVLVHQRTHLRLPTGLGTAPPHDQPPRRAPLRGVRGRAGSEREPLARSPRTMGLQRAHPRTSAAPAHLPTTAPLTSATRTSPASPRGPSPTSARSPA